MKKTTVFVLCLFLLFSFALTVSAEREEEIVFAAESVNVRAEPDTAGEIIAVLQKGDQIARLGEADGRSKVIYKDKERYVASEYLSLSPLEENQDEESAENGSVPRLMVTSYKTGKKRLSPEKTTELEITFKNFSTVKAVYNIKLSLSDPSGDILTVGMPTEYVKEIKADGSYTWKISLKAANTAKVGRHDLQVTAEYEDKSFVSYTANDTIGIDVRQSVRLSHSGALLPKKVRQGDTQTVAVDLMNTGKSKIFNCTLDFDIEGMQSGGSVFVGNIEPAESAQGSANLRVGSDALGNVEGKITITYEDNYGKEYKKTVSVNTVIEEKVEQADIASEKEEEKKNPLWWLFLLAGLAVGGVSGFEIPRLVKDRKQRKEDDLRL